MACFWGCIFLAPALALVRCQMQMNEETRGPLEDEEQVRNKMRDNYFHSNSIDNSGYIDKFEEDGSGLTIYGDI